VFVFLCPYWLSKVVSGACWLCVQLSLGASRIVGWSIFFCRVRGTRLSRPLFFKGHSSHVSARDGSKVVRPCRCRARRCGACAGETVARLLLFVLNAGTPVASDGLVCVRRPQPTPIRLVVKRVMSKWILIHFPDFLVQACRTDFCAGQHVVVAVPPGLLVQSTDYFLGSIPLISNRISWKWSRLATQ